VAGDVTEAGATEPTESTDDGLPPLGLAISTIGRPELPLLLRTAAESTRPPAAVALANQSGRQLPLEPACHRLAITMIDSEGGVSAGRNAAVAALPGHVRVVGFPNDDSRYPPETLRAVAERFAGENPPAALACRLQEANPRLRPLPPPGTLLDRDTVWQAIEPALFVDRAAFEACGGFRTDLGVGAPSPWQSGEGTDLLLRFLAAGLRVISASDLAVDAVGERRDLGDDEFVAKHRRYARGTGYVYRIHPYPLSTRLRILLGPWARLRTFDGDARLARRIAFARSLGRIEGLLGREFGRH
jgi:hypothetical protein